MRSALTTICAFTMLASGWLFVMFLVLRHPGFEWRALVSIGFAAIGALTLAGIRRPGLLWRVSVASGAVVLGAAGVWAIKTNVDEGFVDVIGLSFVVQAILTLAYLLARQVRGPGPGSDRVRMLS